MMLVYRLKSKIFRQISAKLLPKTKMQLYCGELVLGWEVLTISETSTISEQDFNQNVGEVAHSIYLAVY